MSWKFNPPPGWPAQPEGWQPPPGWAPDPSWPPAPAGWQFWVPATPTPPPGPPQQGTPQSGPPQPGSPGPTVHDAPTSLANPTVPVQASPAGSYEPAPPYSPGPAYAPSSTPSSTGSYPPAGPYPPAGGPSYQPAGGPSYQPAGAYPPPGGAPPRPSGGTPWHQQWWAIGGVALAVLLVGCVGGGAAAVLTDSDSGDPSADPPAPTAPAPTGPAPSDSPNPPDPGGGEALGPGEEQSGEGPTIIPLDLPTDSLHTVTMEYTGSGFFASSLVDDAGEVITSLGSTEFGQTDYTGVWPLDVGLFGLGPAAGIDITNAEDGTWTVRVEDISAAPAWPATSEGVGDTVLRVDASAVGDAVTPHGTHDGEANFIVWAYSGEEDFNDHLLFNLIGAVDEDAAEPLTSDQVLLHIQADGNWTLTPP